MKTVPKALQVAPSVAKLSLAYVVGERVNGASTFFAAPTVEILSDWASVIVSRKPDANVFSLRPPPTWHCPLERRRLAKMSRCVRAGGPVATHSPLCHEAHAGPRVRLGYGRERRRDTVPATPGARELCSSARAQTEVESLKLSQRRLIL